MAKLGEFTLQAIREYHLTLREMNALRDILERGDAAYNAENPVAVGALFGELEVALSKVQDRFDAQDFEDAHAKPYLERFEGMMSSACAYLQKSVEDRDVPARLAYKAARRQMFAWQKQMNRYFAAMSEEEIADEIDR